MNKIAIVGYGIEGESAYNFLKKKYPKAKFVIYDQSVKPKNELPTGVENFLGNFDLKEIEADLIIRTPAIPPNKFRKNANLSSVTKLFFENCPGKIIGVTGSKGKGTTASLIASILNSAGKTTHLIGNIGIPALDELQAIGANDYVIYELSSFQLWDLDISPDIAVIVHIEPDHLDVHSSFEEYIGAKANIAKHQSESDVIVYDATNPHSSKIASYSKAELKFAYPSKESAWFDEKLIYYGEQIICSISDLKIIGNHNISNACAAIDVAWQFTNNIEAIKAGLIDFKGLEHRLKLVDIVNGVAYYDDSIATTIGSVRAALKAIKMPKILIMGGSSKGANFKDIISDINAEGVYLVIAIGDEADRIEDALSGTGKFEFINFHSDKSMKEIVFFAHSIAKPGSAVILSPACASFGMFRDYKDRGEQFIRAVKEL